jgi:hypothetical protein
MSVIDSPIDLEPGNFAMVLGHREAQAKLLRASDDIDDWLYELSDAFAFEAADRLRVNAPGSIPELVDVQGSRETSPGNFEAIGGVEPDFSPATSFGRGLGSDPADYPVYVDQGTGIYGSRHEVIYPIPGHVMGPVFYRGRNIYIRSSKGQPAQHFSDASFRGVVDWAPTAIALALPDLERKIDR